MNDFNNIDNKKNKFTLKFSWYTTLIAIVLAVLITFMATYSVLYVRFSAAIDRAVVENTADSMYDKSVLDAIAEIYSEYYVGELGTVDPGQYFYLDTTYLQNFDKDTVTDILASLYVVWTGDKYGAYYSPSSMNELENYFAGETVGIGVMITYDQEEHTLEVLYTMDGSPAEEAGVEPGDLIIRVGDLLVSESTYEQVVNAIKGDEGTSVQVTFLRGEEELTYEIMRKTVAINTVFGRMASDGKTGIIRITEFTNETPSQFISAVEALETQGATQFVFDLRDNGGGTLEGVLGVLSYILPQSTPLIKVVDKYGTESYDYSNNEHIMDCPMTVLVNENTASAAELFTINLRDHQVATIVGTKTYGKGVMQTFFQLPNGGMVKVTYKWYSSAKSDNYDGIGITPHIVEEMDSAFANTNLFKIADEDDNQLQKALQTLSK